MGGNIYGYIRVSAKEQNLDRQLLAMHEFGLVKSKIYFDKQSGKDFERLGYQRLIKKLKSNDTLVISSIDRLGRNYEDILSQWRYITKEKGAAIVVLDMPLLNTEKDRDLSGTLVSDIVLQLLSYVAQKERELIRQRQAEGIAAAKLKRVRFGRPKLPTPENFAQIVKDWKSKRISINEAILKCGMSEATFYQRLKEATSDEKLS